MAKDAIKLGIVVEGAYANNPIYSSVHIGVSQIQYLVICCENVSFGFFSNNPRVAKEIKVTDVENYEILSSQQISGDAGNVMWSTLLFGVVGTIAASRQVSSNEYLISINFSDGQKSLIQLNSTGYEIFVSEIVYKLESYQKERNEKLEKKRKAEEELQNYIAQQEKQRDQQEKQAIQLLEKFKQEQDKKNKELAQTVTVQITSTCLESSQIMNAVKIIRSALQCSLKEAKNFIDNHMSIECNKKVGLTLIEELETIGCKALIIEQDNDEISGLNMLISENSNEIDQPQLENNLQLIKQLKELFDCGVLTQEEFDAKKKQLLGL